MTWKTVPVVVSAAILSVGASACSHEASATGLPWDNGSTRVVGDDRRVTEVGGADDDACVPLLDTCVKPKDACGAQPADVVLDAQGKVVDYLCYPSASSWTVEHLNAEHGDLSKHDNDAVLVLDDLDDGADIVGDVNVDANNVVLYGASPHTSVLAGDLTLAGNNALVRGLRIQGDVTIDKNNATLAFCVIEGSLTIRGNNTKVLGCDVLGGIEIEGNNTQLYADHVVGRIADGGKNTECRDDVAARDANGDRVIGPSELGLAISCD